MSVTRRGVGQGREGAFGLLRHACQLFHIWTQVSVVFPTFNDTRADLDPASSRTAVGKGARAGGSEGCSSCEQCTFVFWCFTDSAWEWGPGSWDGVLSISSDGSFLQICQSISNASYLNTQVSSLRCKSSVISKSGFLFPIPVATTPWQIRS